MIYTSNEPKSVLARDLGDYRYNLENPQSEFSIVLSASRRTDIPNYYAEWFLNRIKEGFLYVRNPMNPHQVSRIPLSPKVVDCIVFWTKNPEPMLHRLDELAAYSYYFQFTLTGYGRDIEPNVPHKKEKMLAVFRQLSEKIGSKRVIWRYDPILFTNRYTPEYHISAFGQIAAALQGYTEKCVISFVDAYAKNKKNMERLQAYELEERELLQFTGQIATIAKAHGMRIASCAETLDLSACGVEHNACIDGQLIEEITGRPVRARKDKNQRPACGCVESIEIGTYDTCPNGCLYCYANSSQKSVARQCSAYDPKSPLLCGIIQEGDRITERGIFGQRKKP